jgi:hypothetical protein
MSEVDRNTKNSRSRASVVIDFIAVAGFVAFLTALSAGMVWGPITHLLLPLALLPLVLFVSHRLWGASLGQYLLGLESRTGSGNKATRFYDWFFLLSPRPAQLKPATPLVILVLVGMVSLLLGSTLFLWMRDPTVRPYTNLTIPLFAPEAGNKDWQVLPFFYANGAFPTRLLPGGGDMEFGLPYEKGPPNRFLGKITAYWRDLDSRLTLTGPLSVASPETPAALSDCVTHWFRCLLARRALWRSTIAPHFGGRALAENAWFNVENLFLAGDEKPQGLYLRSTPERGRIREAYFLVGPKMAIQSFILDRPDRSEGEKASAILRKVIGSLRVASDLQTPRAFINPKLGAIRLTDKSSLSDLISAEGLLLAKVSIEPKGSESFYHLGGLALTLFRAAKREGKIELAASSKTIVKSSLRYARDVEPNSKRIPEMERFETEVEAP